MYIKYFLHKCETFLSHTFPSSLHTKYLQYVPGFSNPLGRKIPIRMQVVSDSYQNCRKGLCS